MDKVLAVNSGSSSLKFKLFEMPSEAVIASGLIERIAIPGSQTTIKYGNGKVYKHQGTVKNHGEAVNNLMELLISLGIIEKYSEITGVGHRVVAGGEYFSKSVVVTDEVIRKIKNITELAPLHNPANLKGIFRWRISCRTRLRSPCSTPRSTRPFRPKTSCMPFPINITKSIAYAVMVSMGRAISMLHRWVAR